MYQTFELIIYINTHASHSPLYSLIRSYMSINFTYSTICMMCGLPYFNFSFNPYKLFLDIKDSDKTQRKSYYLMKINMDSDHIQWTVLHHFDSKTPINWYDITNDMWHEFDFNSILVMGFMYACSSTIYWVSINHL